MINSKSKVAAGLFSLVAVCGTVAWFQNMLSLNPSQGTQQLHNHNQHSQNNNHRNRRRLSRARPNGGCHITWPTEPSPGTEITYAASYPGCGARMTWNLVEALTGLLTGDDWNNNGRGSNVVTVKTHYPQSNGILVDFDTQIQRAFIVIRNPMNSIPSFFNHIYEMRNHLPVHSERAPLEEWIKWRNVYLDTEIEEYEKFIIYWMDRYTPENRLLITYEGLTDDVIGAEVTKGLSLFLGQAKGVTTIHPDSVPCIWRAVVKNEPPAQQAAQIMKSQSLASNQPTGMQHSQPQQQGTSSVLLPQPDTNSGLLDQQPLSNSAGMIQDQTTSQSIKQQQQSPLLEQQQESLDSDSDSLDDLIREMETKLADGKKLLQQQQQPNGQRLLRTSQRDQTVPSDLLPSHIPVHEHNRHRRLDPAHHNSQRQGPDVPRPYTPEQLDNMMLMLSKVALRYQNVDARLYHVMMGYYEQIRIAQADLLGPEEGGGFY